MNTMSNMSNMQTSKTVQVSFRLPHELVERLREASAERAWPPPPSQTDIVIRGIEHVLKTMKTLGKRSARAKTG